MSADTDHLVPVTHTELTHTYTESRLLNVFQTVTANLSTPNSPGRKWNKNSQSQLPAVVSYRNWPTQHALTRRINVYRPYQHMKQSSFNSDLKISCYILQFQYVTTCTRFSRKMRGPLCTTCLIWLNIQKIKPSDCLWFVSQGNVHNDNYSWKVKATACMVCCQWVENISEWLNMQLLYFFEHFGYNCKTTAGCSGQDHAGLIQNSKRGS